VELQYSSDGGRSWHGLGYERTAAGGAWNGTGRFVAGRLWRVRWVSAQGTAFVGAPTRAYGPTGKLYK
jgi:hypothetical protein